MAPKQRRMPQHPGHPRAPGTHLQQLEPPLLHQLRRPGQLQQILLRTVEQGWDVLNPHNPVARRGQTVCSVLGWACEEPPSPCGASESAAKQGSPLTLTSLAAWPLKQWPLQQLPSMAHPLTCRPCQQPHPLWQQGCTPCAPWRRPGIHYRCPRRAPKEEDSHMYSDYQIFRGKFLYWSGSLTHKMGFTAPKHAATRCLRPLHPWPTLTQAPGTRCPASSSRQCACLQGRVAVLKFSTSFPGPTPATAGITMQRQGCTRSPQRPARPTSGDPHVRSGNSGIMSNGLRRILICAAASTKQACEANTGP